MSRIAFAAAAALAACTGAVPVGPPRDWAAHPAFVVEPAPLAARVWVVSDVHGGFDRLVTLLRAGKVIDLSNHWTGGAAHLYVLGDLIDKAEGGLPTIELLMALQQEAPAAGGAVVVTLGNHEAEFLADPTNSKAGPFLTELKGRGLVPFEVARGEGLGAWLRDLPIGLLDGAWFLSHGGNTAGQSLDAMAAKLQADLDKNQFAARSLVGADSILEASQWWPKGADAAPQVDAALTALSAKHLVFGHDPNAFGQKGALAQKLAGRMFLVDVGMSPAVDYSTGAMLLLERGATTLTASAVFPDGSTASFYTE